MECIIETIIFTVVANFAIFVLIIVMYTICNFSMPNHLKTLGIVDARNIISSLKY